MRYLQAGCRLHTGFLLERVRAVARSGAAAPAGQLGFVAARIAEERREANRIKTEQPILVITGNPPYRRLDRGEDETLLGRWLDQL